MFAEFNNVAKEVYNNMFDHGMKSVALMEVYRSPYPKHHQPQSRHDPKPGFDGLEDCWCA